jgi:very-short-patch-repair endonuclease
VLTAPGDTVHRARRLRKTMSLPEVLLWKQLKLRPSGFKFRKQHPAGFYVLDFFCVEVKLAIEVDGEAHNRGDQPAFDEARDRQLHAHGIATLRVPAVEVLNNLEGVLVHLLEAVRNRIPPRNGEVAARSDDGGAVGGGCDSEVGDRNCPSALRAPPRSGEDLG